MKNRIYTFTVVVLTGLIASTVILLLSLWIAGSAKNPIVASSTPAPSASPVQISQKTLWSIIQKWRVESGYTPYKESQYSCSFADVRVKQVQTEYSHNGFLDLTKNAFKPAPGNSVQENLANNYSEGYMMYQWLNSPPHRKALETNWPNSCLRCENNYCVQVFSTY